MMIRINLLPVRAVKKREMGRQVLVLFGLVLVGAGVGNFFWYNDRQGEHDRNAAGVANTKTKIAELDKVIGEVKNINDRKLEVEKKLAVLDGLRKGRSGPVRMLDALSNAMPKKAWLTGFTEERGSVKLQGSALSHDDVAELMRGLATVVWTPRGVGKLVEQRRDAKTSRVELLSGDATVEEFPVTEIKPFFSNIDLKQVTQMNKGDATKAVTVEFDITLTANYAI